MTNKPPAHPLYPLSGVRNHHVSAFEKWQNVLPLTEFTQSLNAKHIVLLTARTLLIASHAGPWTKQHCMCMVTTLLMMIGALPCPISC